MAGVKAKITGIGSAVPSKVMTNSDFEKIIDTNDEWIVQRTGIRERHVVSDGEHTSVLAVKAASEALKNAGVQASELDLIIIATCTPDMPLPSTACLVQKALGATDVPCFDLAAACSGFLYGLSVGSQFIETGKYRKILVVGVDTLTTMTDYQDRGSCIIFGDGAGAVILEPTTEENAGVLYTVLKADGEGWDFITTPAGGSKRPASHETVDAREHFIKMKGREVYKFAVEKMQWLLGDCMEKTGLTVEDVDLVVPHQVNIRIIESATQKHNFPIEKVYTNIDRRGNTSAASIPLALDEANKEGLIGPGKTIVMVAFGAGLTWAGAVVRF